MRFGFEDKGEPDFVNELGVKWWKQDDLNEYAHERGLPIANWYVETPDDDRSYVMVALDNNDIIHRTQQFEGMCHHIDALFAVECFDINDERISQGLPKRDHFEIRDERREEYWKKRVEKDKKK